MMTDAEVFAALGGDTPLNRARREFSSACGRIEQAGQQRSSINPIELRRMEFEAIEKIIAAHAEQPTSFQQRVVAEKRELDEKLIKLVQFISTSPVFAGLNLMEQNLLREQRDAMMRYSEVLEARIAWFS